MIDKRTVLFVVAGILALLGGSSFADIYQVWDTSSLAIFAAA